ncbi:MAG: alpha/beta hydrolase, partial [Sphingomonas sp.]
DAPSFRRLLGEIPAIVGVYLASRRATPRVDPTRGDGRPVIVLPGFLTDDTLTRPLRHALRAAGYDAHGWALGRNCGATPDLIARLTARIEAIGGGHRVALVGWSLGGLYARELAKQRPDLVERVVTMGTPFSGDPRANNAWRLYERVAGHKVDAPPIPIGPQRKPPVPTIALWSRRDGIVAPAASRGEADESDRRVAVDCLHTAFAYHPRAIAAVLDALEG